MILLVYHTSCLEGLILFAAMCYVCVFWCAITYLLTYVIMQIHVFTFSHLNTHSRTHIYIGAQTRALACTSTHMYKVTHTLHILSPVMLLAYHISSLLKIGRCLLQFILCIFLSYVYLCYDMRHGSVSCVHVLLHTQQAHTRIHMHTLILARVEYCLPY